jgi:hypothetical protein
LVITKSIATIARYFFNPAMISAVNFEAEDVVDGEDDDDDEDDEDADESEDERFIDFEGTLDSISENLNSLVDESIYKFANIIFHLVLVLESMFPNVKNQEKQQLEEYLSNYTINYFLERMTTVLHVTLISCNSFLNLELE